MYGRRVCPECAGHVFTAYVEALVRETFNVSEYGGTLPIESHITMAQPPDRATCAACGTITLLDNLPDESEAA